MAMGNWDSDSESWDVDGDFWDYALAVMAESITAGAVQTAGGVVAVVSRVEGATLSVNQTAAASVTNPALVSGITLGESGGAQASGQAARTEGVTAGAQQVAVGSSQASFAASMSLAKSLSALATALEMRNETCMLGDSVEAQASISDLMVEVATLGAELRGYVDGWDLGAKQSTPWGSALTLTNSWVKDEAAGNQSWNDD